MSERTMRTISGVEINPFTMREGDINIEDIATGLSNMGRYNGQTNYHYSVAQHSVILAHIVPVLLGERRKIDGNTVEGFEELRDLGAAALMHDASEAYTQDIVVSLKANTYFKDPNGKYVHYDKVERRVQNLIFSKWNLDISLLEDVHEFDKRICVNEKTVLWPGFNPATAGLEAIENKGTTPLIVPWSQSFAKQKFLQVFKQLEIDRNDRSN